MTGNPVLYRCAATTFGEAQETILGERSMSPKHQIMWSISCCAVNGIIVHLHHFRSMVVPVSPLVAQGAQQAKERPIKSLTGTIPCRMIRCCVAL